MIYFDFRAQPTSNSLDEVEQSLETPICFLLDQRTGEKRPVGRTELCIALQEEHSDLNYIKLPFPTENDSHIHDELTQDTAIDLNNAVQSDLADLDKSDDEDIFIQ